VKVEGEDLVVMREEDVTAVIESSAMKSAREISCYRAGSPAVTCISARDRSIRLRSPIKHRSNTAPVAPDSLTFPTLMALIASVAV
jgi:hypothetical protein